MAKIDFSWTPVSSALTWTINGHTYPYSRQADNIDRSAQVGSLDSRYAAYTTLKNTLLTFVASVTLPTGLTAVEYRWDWGDGGLGFGSTATHTYLVAPPETQVNLTVIDSRGGVWYASKVLNLR